MVTFITGDVVMAKRGRKDCSHCNTEIGARCHLCPECGFYFPENKIRLDLLEEKNKPAAVIFYDKPGRGRKTCPDCSKIMGGTTKRCPGCDFDFISAKKEKVAAAEKIKEDKPEKIEKIDPRVAELGFIEPYVAPKRLSPKDHAQRILSYGVERARNLLNLARIHRYWSHVDWDVVEKGLI